jgi:hypothetical protein
METAFKTVKSAVMRGLFALVGFSLRKIARGRTRSSGMGQRLWQGFFATSAVHRSEFSGRLLRPFEPEPDSVRRKRRFRAAFAGFRPIISRWAVLSRPQTGRTAKKNTRTMGAECGALRDKCLLAAMLQIRVRIIPSFA